ncbi:MAG: hypothetical protein WD045_13005 [Pirellulaceae bacterium]
MGAILQILGGIIGIVSLVCYVLVIVKIFQSGDTTMGIICLVTLLLCGLGGLITFILGWIKRDQYGTHQIMPIWTGAIILGFLVNGAAFSLMN